MTLHPLLHIKVMCDIKPAPSLKSQTFYDFKLSDIFAKDGVDFLDSQHIRSGTRLGREGALVYNFIFEWAAF